MPKHYELLQNLPSLTNTKCSVSMVIVVAVTDLCVNGSGLGIKDNYCIHQIASGGYYGLRMSMPPPPQYVEIFSLPL